MTAKEYLQGFYKLGLDVKTIRREIADIEEERDSITVNMDGQPRGSKTSDRTAAVALELVELLEKEYERLHALNLKYWNRRLKIAREIRSMDDRLLARILTLRYMQGDTWESIAVEIGYSYQHTCRLHGEALRQFEKVADIP